MFSITSIVLNIRTLYIITMVMICFLFHLEKDTAWVNLKITCKMCDFNMIEKSPIEFLKRFLCEKFKLEIKYIYSVV